MSSSTQHLNKKKLVGQELFNPVYQTSSRSQVSSARGRHALKTPEAKSEGGNHLGSDVYSILSVRGSHDDSPRPSRMASSHNIDGPSSALPGDPTVVETAILERVAAIPRGRARLSMENVAAKSPDCPGTPAGDNTLRRIFFRNQQSNSGAKCPPRSITCMFCGEVLHCPAQLPCGHMADLECLVSKTPLDECPLCKNHPGGMRSLSEIAIPEATMRRLDKDRMSYLKRMSVRDRRFGLSHHRHLFSHRQADQTPNGPGESRTPMHLRSKFLRLFRRRHNLDTADDTAKLGSKRYDVP
eukprot:Blabericola_migrator_1__11939@NODE_72_length_15243_cov_214_481220_g65_i0_p7_GENE_NODE_72_length_15243_cov_214_481220_g65_i0NODE_72_length_15243_cov_214_481220_g65_i0_p7_ORF_typecomplete_len298_score18_31ProkRING_4/PF14447_6/0_00046zfC3HC4_3/PF13920_6/0_059zfRING_2/PF13639_6/0_73zfC3HC4/PF00097_25/0_81zfRING_6/PF14835_6/0_86zfRING_5/PF14634_6/6e02zfRING_5/PF14634_6/1_1zfC3HC4_4/PF15227_6/4_3e03zfC3HC4_4/PF15227_6/1_8_NODE_72_length_15243_cov_214_481220_g65_i052176110